jgi:hypothetical protein
MASMLENDPETSRNVHPFLIPTRLLEGDLLLAGLGERLAREIHAAYLAERDAKGERDAEKASHAEWRDLREDYRESNRAQAAHIGPKLQEIGCGMVPIADWDAPPAEFSDDEIEKMAILEHERFVKERLDTGRSQRKKWRRTPSADPGGTDSSVLVPWEQLAPSEKDKDRDAVRIIPMLLARAGYQVVRPEATE